MDTFWTQFADSPDALSYLEAHFRGADEATQLLLLEGTDDSAFSVREWVEALLVLDRWLESRDLALPIEDQIGYVSCAGESAGAGAALSHLPTLVREMLEAYGCERAAKK